MAIQHITIQYSPDSGSNWYTIEQQYSVDSGSYDWTAPDTESTQYLIRVYDSGAFADGYDLGEAYDVSDTTFSIAGPIYGTLEYSPDSGSNWYVITSSLVLEEGTGSYTWYTPETESANYLIRISDPSASDTSDATFKVIGPKYATIEYSTDSGSNWHIITSSLLVQQGIGSYTWYAPETASTDYLIRISTSSYSDSSDNTFTVLGPYSMSGNIQSGSGYILPSVTLTYSNGVGIASYDTLTGDYISDLFTSSFSGTLIPTATNYIFNPVSRSYTNQIENTSSQDFEAIYSQSVAEYYFISGSTLVSGTATPISGAKVTFNVYPSTTTIKYSDNNGRYSASFIQNTSASFIATHPLYTFSTPIKTITDLTSNYSDQVFSGSVITYMVSGSIQSASGFLSGIEILCNGCTSSLFTDANGQFSRSYATGSSIILTPTAAGYAFLPSNQVISNISASSYNNDFFATPIIPPGSGLSLYYDSRKSYNDTTKIWPDLSSELPDLDMETYNVYYTDPDKNLLFGAEWLGAASSSFYGIQVSSSFAIELWIAPSTASYTKTVLSTEAGDYPQVFGYISQSKFVVEYKHNLSQTIPTTVKSYNIAESKYNHVVLFASASHLYVWSNGMCYESASMTESIWNGATLGINREFNTSSYQGFIDAVKVWNGIQISLSDVNNYYISRSYWKDLQYANIPSALPPSPFWYEDFSGNTFDSESFQLIRSTTAFKIANDRLECNVGYNSGATSIENRNWKLYQFILSKSSTDTSDIDVRGVGFKSSSLDWNNSTMIGFWSSSNHWAGVCFDYIRASNVISFYVWNGGDENTPYYEFASTMSALNPTTVRTTYDRNLNEINFYYDYSGSWILINTASISPSGFETSKFYVGGFGGNYSSNVSSTGTASIDNLYISYTPDV